MPDHPTLGQSPDFDRYEPPKRVCCGRCGGEGRISNSYELRDYECPACNGSGGFEEEDSSVTLDDVLNEEAEIEEADARGRTPEMKARDRKALEMLEGVR